MSTRMLILCTHDSARRVLAAAMAARLGCDVRAFGAGSTPSGRLNPHALAVLQEAGIGTGGYRSKSRL
jgi:arsenate reductase (thioredoxin)